MVEEEGGKIKLTKKEKKNSPMECYITSFLCHMFWYLWEDFWAYLMLYSLYINEYTARQVRSKKKATL